MGMNDAHVGMRVYAERLNTETAHYRPGLNPPPSISWLLTTVEVFAPNRQLHVHFQGIV